MLKDHLNPTSTQSQEIQTTPPSLIANELAKIAQPKEEGIIESEFQQIKQSM